MNRERKEIINNNKISKIESFNLGGYLQKVLFEGKSEDLPIVLTLHGGPGTPIPFCVGCRGLFKDFTDNFIMVYWDQFGCGINNYKEDIKLSINLYLQMTKDLINEIKKMFPNNKLFIFSQSWGTVLSTLVTKECKEDINAVIAWGQITKKVLFNEDAMEELSNSKISKKKLLKIQQIDKDRITTKDLNLISNAINKYTNGYTNKNGKKTPIFKMVMGIKSSPDYSFKDFIAVVVNKTTGNIDLWKELININLSEDLENIAVPYYIIQGETDVVSPVKYVKQIKNTNSNPNLHLEIVNNSGHMPSSKALSKSIELLLELKNNNR